MIIFPDIQLLLDNFVSYSSSIFHISCHCLLATLSSHWEVSTHWVDFPLEISTDFSLAAFKISSSFLFFSNLNLKCLGVGVFVFVLVSISLPVSFTWFMDWGCSAFNRTWSVTILIACFFSFLLVPIRCMLVPQVDSCLRLARSLGFVVHIYTSPQLTVTGLSFSFWNVILILLWV